MLAARSVVTLQVTLQSPGAPQPATRDGDATRDPAAAQVRQEGCDSLDLGGGRALWTVFSNANYEVATRPPTRASSRTG